MLTDLLMLVPQMLRHAADSDEAREQAVFAAWLVAVGGPIRGVTAPVRLERKTLIVAVPDATWRTQLTSMRGQALFKLNSLLGAPLVTTIEYVINPGLISRHPEAPREFKFTAPEKEAQPLREAADRIADSEIREAFLRAAGKCLERRTK
jgi:predicted nucleic acid-binding Zn ribbon protein